MSYNFKPIKDAVGTELDDTTFRGVTCAYLGGDRDLKTVYTEAFHQIDREDAQKYHALLKQGVKGQLHKSVFSVGFSSDEREEGGLKSILESMAADGGVNDSIVMKLCEKLRDAIPFKSGTNYLIETAGNTVDIKPRGTDRIKIDDASEFSLSFCVINIIPARLADPGLSYDEKDKVFRARITDWVAKKPLASIIYPVPMEDGADLSHALIVSKFTKMDEYEQFVEKLFGADPPVPAKAGFEQITNVISSVVNLAATPAAIPAIDNALLTYKENAEKQEAPEMLTKESLKEILIETVDEETRGTDFEKSFDTVYEEETKGREIPAYSIKSVEKALRRAAISITAVDPSVIRKETVNGEEFVMIPVSAGFITVNSEEI